MKFRLRNPEVDRVDLVDRGANQEAHIVISKSLTPTEKRDFSTQRRKDLAGSGKAMPGGGFPIVTVKDLQNAIHAIGRANNPAAAKKHIMSRARSLGRSDLIPSNWMAKSEDWLTKAKTQTKEKDSTPGDEPDSAEDMAPGHRMQALRSKKKGKGMKGKGSAFADRMAQLMSKSESPVDSSPAQTGGSDSSASGKRPPGGGRLEGTASHSSVSPTETPSFQPIATQLRKAKVEAILQAALQENATLKAKDEISKSIDSVLDEVAKGLIRAEVFKEDTTGKDLRDILSPESLAELTNVMSASQSAKVQPEDHDG